MCRLQRQLYGWLDVDMPYVSQGQCPRSQGWAYQAPRTEVPAELSTALVPVVHRLMHRLPVLEIACFERQHRSAEHEADVGQ